MAAVVRVVDFEGSKLSKVEILRGIVTDKLTTAVREILAVVETTVEGYESEVLLLKRELEHHKGQLQAILQPRVTLYRTGLGDAERPNPVIPLSTDKRKKELRREHEDTENKDCGNNVSNREKHFTSSKNIHNDDELDVQNKDRYSKRTRRLPKRYRQDQDGTDFKGPDKLDTKKNRDNEWKPKKDKKQLSSHGKKQEQHFPKPQAGLSTNSSNADLSNNVVGLEGSAQTDMGQQKGNGFVSFVKQLGITLPEVRPSEELLAEKGSESPLLEKSITLKAAIKSTEIRQFDLKPKEHKETSDAVTKTPTALHDDMPSTSNLEMRLSGSPQSENDDDGQQEADFGRSTSAQKLHGRKREKYCNIKYYYTKYNATCKVCGIRFQSKLLLTNHAVREHVDENTNICAVCGQQVESFELLCHLQGHHWYKPFRCKLCPNAYWIRKNLEEHMWKHRGDTVSCDVCQKALSNPRSLKQHKKIHTGEKKHSCQHCGKLFLTASLKKWHEEIHTRREKTHLCHVCSSTFYNARQLKVHSYIHKEKHINVCPVCTKPIRGTLKRHMMTHTGDKPFSCSTKPFKCRVCQYSCSRKFRLDVHMMSHTGNKPHQCTVCDKSFAVRHRLNSHMKIHREEQAEQAPAEAQVDPCIVPLSSEK